MDQEIIAAQRKQEYEAHQDIFAGEVWIGAEYFPQGSFLMAG